MEITKNIVYMAQHMNYTGYALVVISSQFYTDKFDNVKKFVSMMNCLVEDKV